MVISTFDDVAAGDMNKEVYLELHSTKITLARTSNKTSLKT
ncbi:hypothetical protein [Paenibacillus albus]|nr:hypothetical protein [Paenibacillus albus]